MTYCVGLKLDRGIIFASDTRTSAGVDNIAVFSKTNVWEIKGDRVIVMLSAGNLAVTQAVVSRLNEEMKSAEDGEETLLTMPTMFQTANHIGRKLASESHTQHSASQQADLSAFSASFILGGQIHGEPPRLFQIYNEGNFIEATDDTPYFQIGEHKYGKPILDRVAVPTMRMGQAAKLLLLSFDSTLRSNLSVGMPIDLTIYRTDTFFVGEKRRIEQNDPYFRRLSAAWSEALRDAFTHVQEYEGEDGETAAQYDLGIGSNRPD